MLGVICHGIFLYNYTLLKVLVSRYDISVTSVLFQKKNSDRGVVTVGGGGGEIYPVFCVDFCDFLTLQTPLA